MALSVCFVFTITLASSQPSLLMFKTTVVAEGNGWSECVCTSLYPCSYSFSSATESGRCHNCSVSSTETYFIRCPASSCSTWWTGPAGAWLLFCMWVRIVCVCVCVWWSDAEASHTCCCECFIRAWIRRSICFLYLTVPSWFSWKSS